MTVFQEKNGSRSINAPPANSRFITLPSGEIWTLESTASLGQTRCQRAIYTLLARARYEREEIESLYRSLAGIAAQAHALRDVDASEPANPIMLRLPVSSQPENVARHYEDFSISTEDCSRESQRWCFRASGTTTQRGTQGSALLASLADLLIAYLNLRCCLDLKLLSTLAGIHQVHRCRREFRNRIGCRLRHGRQMPRSGMEQGS